MRSAAIHLIAALLCAGSARADLIVFDEDRAGWEAAVGAFSTADFLGFPLGPFEPDIYADLGMLIVEPAGSDYGVGCCDKGSFVRDGAGIHGHGELELVFAVPITALALDFNGHYFATLWLGETELDTTEVFGASGHGNYAGFVSTMPFDRVVLSEPFSEPSLSIDDIHFGPPIPAPGALMILAGYVAGLGRRRRP